MKCIRKPKEVEAIQFTGMNYDEIYNFCRGYNVAFIKESHAFLVGNFYIQIGDYIIKEKDKLSKCYRTQFDLDYEIKED